MSAAKMIEVTYALLLVGLEYYVLGLIVVMMDSFFFFFFFFLRVSIT